MLKLTLKVKLTILFLAVALVPLLSAVLFQTIYLQKITTKQIEINENTTSKSSSDMVNDWVNDKISQLSEIIKEHPEFQDLDKSKILPVIKVLHESDVDIDGCTFVDKTGYGINDSGIDMQLADRDYFKKIKETKAPVVSDVLINESDGRQVIVVAVPILDKEGNFLGLINSTIDIDDIIKKMERVKSADTGYAYLTSQTGNIISYPDKSMVGKKLEQVFNAQVAKLFSETVLARDGGSINYVINRAEKIATYSKIPLTGWRVIVTAPAEEVYSDLNRSMRVSVIIIIAAVLLILIVSTIAVRFFSKPILQISGIIQGAAQGDITGRTAVKTKDEIGELANNINKMFDSFSKIIGHVKSKADEVDNSAVSLSATSHELASSSQEVADAIQHVSQGASEQSKDLSDVLSAMENFGVLLDNIFSSLNSIKVGTDLTEKLSNSGSGQMKFMTMATNDVSESFDAVITNVSNLSGNIKKIDEITAVIKGISDQTNLLALNAAIEAARAGEAGRGFAVVAEEIRRLADQSRAYADKIVQVIKAIFVEADETVGLSSEVKNKLNAQIEQINSTTKSFEEILNSVFETSPMIKKTFEEADSLIKEKEKVFKSIQSVAAISQETSASTEEISASADQMSVSTEEIASASQTLQKVSNELVNNIKAFKI
ncbi:MAG TPA: methyl-accepting chemotaxis protein [Clostridia bacterium]